MAFNSPIPSFNPASLKRYQAYIVSGIIALPLVFGSYYTIDEKERGVILRNGELIGVADPGLHLKIPFIDSVKRISIQHHTDTYKDVAAYSRDQQAAKLIVSVSWHVDAGQVSDLYRSFGDVPSMVSRLIARQVPTQAENVFGRYTAISVVQNRSQFVTDLGAALRESVSGPVTIDSVQVENVDFSDAYERSIEMRMKAEVEVKTREQMLATEKVQAEIRITQAQADAEAKLTQAKAEAEATRLRGEAEADAIKARAAALASNQNLVELTKAERWDGKLPTTMLPNSAIPFLSPKN